MGGLESSARARFTVRDHLEKKKSRSGKGHGKSESVIVAIPKSRMAAIMLLIALEVAILVFSYYSVWLSAIGQWGIALVSLFITTTAVYLAAGVSY